MGVTTLTLLLLMLPGPFGQDRSAQNDVVHIPAGEFTMGASSDDARPDERPPHRIFVDAFHMSKTEITNRQFQQFIDATGYVTTAERPVDWEQLKKQVPPGTPKPDDATLQPGSMVFVQPPQGTSPNDVAARWAWVPGTRWSHPEGPNSSVGTRWRHPVVHVSHEDATAYALWRGGSLPTEAQWEWAARGGLKAQPFVWGDAPIEPTHANVWQGVFPTKNTGADGHLGTAPVGAFPPNAYGLVDMAGNVWEWTADRYQHDLYRSRAHAKLTRNPAGPATSSDPRNPHAPDTRVHRGGSFLCHASYCSSYRPAARMATTPDSAMSHLGFRIVFSEAQRAALIAAETATSTPSATH